jgi:hypothetical protein
MLHRAGCCAVTTTSKKKGIYQIGSSIFPKLDYPKMYKLRGIFTRMTLIFKYR